MSEQLFHVGVKALVKNKEGKYLLLQVNPAELRGSDNPAYWDIPGGRIQKGQNWRDALEREVDEELGVAIASEPQFFAGTVANIMIPTDDGEVGLVLLVYTVEIPENATLKLSFEHLGFEWVDGSIAAERLSHKYPPDFTDRFKI